MKNTLSIEPEISLSCFTKKKKKDSKENSNSSLNTAKMSLKRISTLTYETKSGGQDQKKEGYKRDHLKDKSRKKRRK